MSIDQQELYYEDWYGSSKCPPDALWGLSKQIWDKYQAVKQTREEFKRKTITWKTIALSAKTAFPNFGLYIAGSSLNGFGFLGSDLDLYLISTGINCNKYTSLHLLKRLTEFLIAPITWSNVKMSEIPVLKFKNSLNDVNGNITLDRKNDIRATYLLYCYSQIDWRVQPLAMVIQLWARKHEIDTQNNSLSDYSLILMLIYFLQKGVNRPVLPILQDLLKDKFKQTLDFTNVREFSKTDVPFTTCNFQSLEELLREFFYYYRSFNYQTVISIRKGIEIPKAQYKLKYSHDMSSYNDSFIFIEDPITLRNVTRHIRNPETVRKLMFKANKSYYILRSRRNHLDTIFHFE